MRPEMYEYNYDWMMARILKMASTVPMGTKKETELTYRYIPHFQILKPWVDAGPAGVRFLHLIKRYFRNILTARDQGKKIVGTTFCNTPAIIYAMDMVPATFEILTAIGSLVYPRGMFDYMDYCVEIGMPETSCSSQRGFMGAFLAGLFEEISFLVCDTPGVCDTNANAFAFAASYLNKPFYQLNYPSVIGDDRSQKYHIDDYKELVSFLELHSGKKLDYDRLGEVLKEIDKQDAITADIEDMLLMVPTPIPPIFNLAMYAGRFCFAGHPEYTELLEAMRADGLQQIKNRDPGLNTGKEKLRAYMCYIDHYTVEARFYDYLEERGVAHVGSILTRNYREGNKYVENLPGNSYNIDTSSPDAMLDSMAQMNARLPMVRSIRGPYDGPGMWLDETLACAKLYQADCVIYNGTPGCRNTWGMLKPFVREVERNGYPVHIMNDDAFDDRTESWDATRERLDEFFHVRGLL